MVRSTTTAEDVLTSVSVVLFAAFANSPAARSCSSLAAVGFVLWVSLAAFLAWM